MPNEWSDGSGYESYVGRWSRRVAREFVRWLAVEPGAAWLDLGCGTGALSQTILDEASPRIVVGCDRSPEYVSFAREHVADPRASFVVARPPDLPDTRGGFDAAVAGLVLNFLPVPADGVGAMIERTRSGGSIGAYVWDYAEGMQPMRAFWDAATSLDANARDLDEGVRFPICRPEALHALFEGAGLREVRVQSIVVPTVFRDFEDYWTPFLAGQGPAPGYLMSLPPERRVELRDAVHERLPIASDGTISLGARAWAAKGIAARAAA